MKKSENSMVVSHHNYITESIFNMNELQINIFTTLIFKVKHKDGKVQLDSKEIKNLCSKHRGNKTFKDNLEALQEKVFKFKEGKRYRSIVPFPTLDFDTENGTVEVRINEDIEPYIKELKGQFTKYSLLEFLSISGVYPKRIYQLLKQYNGSGKRKMSVLFIKESLGIEDTKMYKRFDKFEERILKHSVEEINNKTSMKIKYKKIKSGRSIRNIEFTFNKTSTFGDLDNKIIEVEDINNTKSLENAILRVKKNIYVSKSWNKRVDNKISKIVQDQGEDFTIHLLNELYKNLKQEVKTTLVQYINGMLKNMKEDSIAELKPKQIINVELSKQKSEELKIEEVEPESKSLKAYKKKVLDLAKQQNPKYKTLEIMGKMATIKTMEEMEKLILEYSINEKLPEIKEPEKDEELNHSKYNDYIDKLYEDMNQNDSSTIKF